LPGKARKPQRKEYGTVAPALARGALTVGFTRAAGLVKELPLQEQLQARMIADFGRR
jgi:hypothetical protein